MLTVEKLQCFRDREIGKIRNAQSADRNGQRRFLQTPAAAVGTWDLRHALLNVFTHRRALRFLIATLEIVDDTLEFSFDHTEAFVFLKAKLELFALCSVQDRVKTFLRNCSDRVGQLEVIPSGKGVKIHFGDRIALHISPTARCNGAVHDAE